jgi:hypothetical protein
MMALYKAAPGVSLRSRLEAWTDPERTINPPKKRRRRVVPTVAPTADLKRAVTRFGIVEMPVRMSPEALSAETILDDSRIRLVPDRELTSPERSLLERMSVEALPKLNPRPALSDAQLCFLQVVAELESQGAPFGWDEAFLHFSTVRGITKETMRFFNGKRAGDSLLQRGLLMEGPRLTRAGKRRVAEHEEALRLKAELGIEECPLVRIEKHAKYKAYDEIYVTKDGKERCFFRYETRGFKCPRIVYVANRARRSPATKG